MKLTHVYRIKPSTEQVAIMDTWLEMLRRHFNYALGQRFDWLRRTRCQIDRCSWVGEPIGDIPDKFPSYNFQAGKLKNTKRLFPAYKEIHAEVQQHYRKSQKHLARQQKRLARKESSSVNAQKQKEKVSRIHQRIGRKRETFYYNIAHQLVQKYDLIAVENLNIKGLAKTPLAKSIYDVAWGKFLAILEAVALRSGVHFVKVSPHHTTVNCSGCGTQVPKTLAVRLHECPKCNLAMDRDENAAINILHKALTAVGLTVAACGRKAWLHSG